MTFSVMPSPQTEPFRLTHRNSRPFVTGADDAHASTADFTQSGTGTVRMCAALPTKSAITQCSSLLEVIDCEAGHFAPPQATAEHQCQHRPVAATVVLGNSGTSFPVTFADVEISQSAVSPGDSTVVCRGRSARRTYSEPLMTRSGAWSPYGDTRPRQGHHQKCEIYAARRSYR